MKLADDVAIVTGGTRGIGRQIAGRLAGEGARVVITGRTEELGHRVAAEISETGGASLFVRCDMTSEADVKNLVAETLETFGPPTVLVNNAAPTRLLMGPECIDGAVTDITLENWKEMLNQFVTGPFLAIKYVLPHMVEAKYGSVINIGSVVSQLPIAGQCGYPTGKAAIHGLTRSVAADAGTHNVRCNCIMVGAVPTVDDDFDDVAQAAYLNSMHRGFLDPSTDLGASGPSMQLLGRFGVAADVAALAAFLASKDSSFLTATVIPTDGGLSARWPVPLAEQLATPGITGA